MKIIKSFEVSALICGIAGIITLTYFLISSQDCIIPFEPNPFIRIPEIIWGLFTIPFLIKILSDKLRKKG